MKSEEWRKESISETECNRFLSDSCRGSWNKASKSMQAKLDAKDKEIEALRELLIEAEDYVRAYKCQCNAINGIDGASKVA